jgi:hypothetical protein
MATDDDSENSTGFKKVLLDPRNQSVWKTAVDANLLSSDDWNMDNAAQVRSRGAKNRTLESKAKKIILAMLTPRIVKLVMKETTDKAVYEKDLAQVTPQTHSFKWVLLKRLVLSSFERNSKEECFDWISEKEEQFTQLEGLDLKLPQEILVLALLGGLPQTFNHFIKDYSSSCTW